MVRKDIHVNINDVDINGTNINEWFVRTFTLMNG